MPSPQETRQLMRQLERHHIEEALKQIDGGVTGGFAESTKYDLIVDGKSYPPKRAVGIALNLLSGKQFDPYSFKGGEVSNCFKTLERLKFHLKPKPDWLDTVDANSHGSEHMYGGKRTWEWVLGAIKALGGTATVPQIRAHILLERPDFKVTNIRPDLQLLAVNDNSRGNHSNNKHPRVSVPPNEFDAVFKLGTGRTAQYELYDPAKHGVWELSKVPKSKVLRPRRLQTEMALELQAAIAEGEAKKEFDPSSDLDARTRVVRAIATRQGQPEFRRRLMVAYEGCCAISGCDATDALEAAHIVPYRGSHTNVVRNGMLLRADLHTLFDLGLFRIEPDSFIVVLSEALKASSYKDFDGKALRIPKEASLRPDKDALSEHGKKTNIP